MRQCYFCLCTAQFITVYITLLHRYFTFGCLQRTYSRLQILSGCSNVTTFNLISPFYYTWVESKSDSFLYLWLFILFTFYNYPRVPWSMHGVWISVTGRFFQSYTLGEKTPLQCYNELLFEFTADGLVWMAGSSIVLPAVWPACCFAHGASFSSSTCASLSQCPISAVNSCQGRPGLLGKTVSSADRR